MNVSDAVAFANAMPNCTRRLGLSPPKMRASDVSLLVWFILFALNLLRALVVEAPSTRSRDYAGLYRLAAAVKRVSLLAYLCVSIGLRDRTA